jgi:hypothetical protein
MVRISRIEAPVGSSRPEKRIGTWGATMSAAPTAIRSHPMVWWLMGGTPAA